MKAIAEIEQVAPPPEGTETQAIKGDDGEIESEKWLEIRGQRSQNELWVLKTLGMTIPVIVACIAIFFVSSLFVLGCHYLAPWRWLEPNDISRLQSVMFSGAIGAISSIYASKIFVRET